MIQRCRPLQDAVLSRTRLQPFAHTRMLTHADHEVVAPMSFKAS